MDRDTVVQLIVEGRQLAEELPDLGSRPSCAGQAERAATRLAEIDQRLREWNRQQQEQARPVPVPVRVPQKPQTPVRNLLREMFGRR